MKRILFVVLKLNIFQNKCVGEGGGGGRGHDHMVVVFTKTMYSHC